MQIVCLCVCPYENAPSLVGSCSNASTDDTKAFSDVKKAARFKKRENSGIRLSKCKY